MDKNKYKDYLFLNALLLLNSFGGIFSKLAGKASFLSIEFFFYYGSALFMLIIYAFCWQILMKRLPLVSAYSNKAVAMIWTMLWGILFFEEQIKVNMLAGAVIVLVGVGLVVTADE